MSEPIHFGREEVFSLLLKRVEGFRAGYRQNVAVLGVHGIGKSTVLRCLVRERLAQDPSLIPVYLETGESENLVEWATKLVRSLLYAVLQSRSQAERRGAWCGFPQPQPERRGAWCGDRRESPRGFPQPQPELPIRWSDLIEACAEGSPKTAATARKILELAEAGKADAAYQLCWDLPGWIAQDLGCRVLLVLDEFHCLRHLPVKEPFQVLGQKIMVQNNTMFLVASSELVTARSILREGLALLFGQFESVEMGPVGVASCLEAIRSVWPLPEADPCSVNFLVELGQGHPDNLQQLMHGLKQWKPPVEELVSPDRVVLDVMEALLWHSSAALRQRFEVRLHSLPNHWSRLACVQLLAAVADGAHRLPQMAEATGRSVSQIRRFLPVLEQARWVEKEGSFYRVPERLFRFWLVTAYPALHEVGLADSGQGRAHFRQEALLRIRRSREALRQTLEERVTVLLQKWNGEQVFLEGRRILLPRLERVERRSLDPSGSLLIGRVQEKGRRDWIFFLWKAALLESDARRIVQRVAQEEVFRDPRKVLVSLQPLEINARLILQQAKVKVLDLTVLNRLLELYDLPTLLIAEEAPELWLAALAVSARDPLPSSSSDSREAAG